MMNNEWEVELQRLDSESKPPKKRIGLHVSFENKLANYQLKLGRNHMHGGFFDAMMCYHELRCHDVLSWSRFLQPMDRRLKPLFFLL